MHLQRGMVRNGINYFGIFLQVHGIGPFAADIIENFTRTYSLDFPFNGIVRPHKESLPVHQQTISYR